MLWLNFILGFKLVIILTSPYLKTMGNKIKVGIQLKANFTASLITAVRGLQF